MIQVKVAYISNKPLLVVEHAIPMTGFVGLLAHITVFDREIPLKYVPQDLYFSGVLLSTTVCSPGNIIQWYFAIHLKVLGSITVVY